MAELGVNAERALIVMKRRRWKRRSPPCRLRGLELAKKKKREAGMAKIDLDAAREQAARRDRRPALRADLASGRAVL
ncbi:hypothetical protein J6500_07045 [Bradyrhizobium sp. WSM 1704]|uniref:hypothetical protein n=1 Tax=Bradyrhizobium semiaridum TaxID=2821404 RepID=UPI001CE268F4|nr:hypothetical protein [Bradyrhizobium semiaridum]MCA6121660.1 hypothetical protein [Bradyrhizobium semiaridum]